jgi:hypothetical protein
MLRRLQVLTVAVAFIGFLGCESAEQSDDAASMDEMAAMLSQAQQPNDGTATSSSTSTGSGSETTPSESASPVPASAPDPALATRRGFALHDLSNEAAYIMVKMDAAKAAEAIAKQMKGNLTKNAYGKTTDVETGTIVYQLAGHPWSIYAIMPDEHFDDDAAALSRELGTDVLTFASSDFNGWSFVALYRGGDEVEAIDWGTEGDGLGADADLSKWDSHGSISHTYEDIEFTDQFLFRSKLRKASEQELQQGEAFVDAMFKQYDAYLPDAEDMPWLDDDGIASPLGPTAFAGVHLVTVSVE